MGAFPPAGLARCVRAGRTRAPGRLAPSAPSSTTPSTWASGSGTDIRGLARNSRTGLRRPTRGVSLTLAASLTRLLPVRSLRSGRNPRGAHFDVTDLIESFGRSPQLHNVVVRPVPEAEKQWEVVAGHRRVEAFRKLGYSHIEAKVVSVDDETAERLALEENLRRKALPDEASAVARLIELYGPPKRGRPPKSGHRDRISRPANSVEYVARDDGAEPTRGTQEGQDRARRQSEALGRAGKGPRRSRRCGAARWPPSARAEPATALAPAAKAGEAPGCRARGPAGARRARLRVWPGPLCTVRPVVEQEEAGMRCGGTRPRGGSSSSSSTRKDSFTPRLPTDFV